MLGAIIGDICGSVYEWNNERNEEEIVLFQKGCLPTDDSVMTVAVAKALTDSRGLDDEEIRTLLVDSMLYYGHLFCYVGYGGHFREWLRNNFRDPYNSWGNGSAMRVSAAGWLYDSLEETLHAAKLSADVTHNHPEGIKGAQAIAAAVYLARTGKTKDEIRKYIEENFYRLDFTIAELRPHYDFAESCQGSCPQAIEAFLEADGFEAVIRRAISLGGDSDTIAAMAGAIAEAYYGIPAELEKKAMDCLTLYVQDRKLYGITEHIVCNFGVLADELRCFAQYRKPRTPRKEE